MSVAHESSIQKVTSIEGITEYRLSNGLQVLLLPDQSKSRVTVNMTVFVGSRHEGYGEAGMAHLLEHMLFKGASRHENIPKLMKSRGAEFNGTTWLDRTNYYETLPANTLEQATENLEFAIGLEADRLVNSFIRAEDLQAEMSIVRNEFERGENNPRRILSQRIQAAAFDWHNYGRTTIGNLSDIERFPSERLRAFYRKFYRPDNVMLVVSGKFESDSVLAIVNQHFGSLDAPSEPLDATYTTEPAQDGERSVVLRRVGNTQLVSAAYHVPSGANREFAAMEVLAYIFGTEPSGRLYQELVVPGIATSVSTSSMALHDPGTISFGAEVPMGKSVEAARETLLHTIECVVDSPVTEEEIKRAKTQFLAERELRAVDSKGIAVELSEWAAQGDWRLYFLFRDFVESVTAEECTAAAQRFLTRNNRTVGMFLPSENSQRVAIPPKPDLDELLAGYEGRGEIEQGEVFDPAPLAIEARTERGQLNIGSKRAGLKFAWLPKRTRGGMVCMDINLRYGNEQSLLPFQTAVEFLPEMLMRGTRRLDYQALQDRLDELRAHIRLTGLTGLLGLSVETKREYLGELVPLLGELLREPRFDAEELELLRGQAITSVEASMAEPNALAGLAVRRALAPFDSNNLRYVPTLAERVELFQRVTIDELKSLHATQLSASNGEVSAVGDFDPDTLQTLFEEAFSGWEAGVEHQRISQPAQVQVPGGMQEILTPDKANALYYAGKHIEMRDDHADYPALLVGNYILGASALASRLGDRIRQQENMSYSVGSGLNAHPVDHRAMFTLYAIVSPTDKDRLTAAIDEELEKLLNDGITESELDAAKVGILQSSQLGRTQDERLASLLSSSFFARRDMSYYANFEACIADLTIEQVNAAIRQYLEPARFVAAFAGDFEGVANAK